MNTASVSAARGAPSPTRMDAKSERLLRAKAARVDDTLTKVYGRKIVARRRASPLDTLVLTILSQNTNDVNRDRAYRSLRESYPKWEDLMASTPSRVATAIRVGGLANIKSRRLVDALRFIHHERGRLSLDFLGAMSPVEADAWLSRIKGVGPKTRAIVLLFSLGMPAFPVDTHVHRVTKRIGLIGKRTTRGQAQVELAALVPEAEYYNFHINLIEHGRAVCVARKPKCPVCPVRSLCNYYHEVFLKGQT